MTKSDNNKINRTKNTFLEAKNVDEEIQTQTQTKTLFWILWDEEKGPTLQNNYPPNILNISFIPIETIGNYLFQASVAIYGYADAIASQDLLMRIESLAFSKLNVVKLLLYSKNVKHSCCNTSSLTNMIMYPLYDSLLFPKYWILTD